ncbi:MAG: DUF7662 domain-containing protein [Pseudonocardiaceae bacterium]
MGDGRVVAGDLPAVVHSGVEKAIGIQHSAVAGYVQRLRRARPDATPADIVVTLEKQYLAAVTGAGAAVGGAAAVPGAGTGLALALSAGETAMFLETTALFTLAVAEVHAVRVDEVDSRRALVLTVVLGDGGTMLVDKVAGRASEHWGKLLTDLIPMSSISAINKALCRWFTTQYPRRQGLRVVGKIMPFGIGAAIGAVGNHAFGRMVISACRSAFGPPPAGFADYIDGSVVDNPVDDVAPVIDIPRQAVGPVLRPVPAVDDTAAADPPVSAGAPPPVKKTDIPVTGKYRPLFDYLATRGTDRVELSFSKIEALVTGGLPKSASTKAWWGNSASSRQAKAWLTAGFEVTDVDLGSRRVRFEKRGPTT